MSTIVSIGKNMGGLPDFIEQMEHKLKGWEDNLMLDGKNIQKANVEQPSWLAYYDEIASSLSTAVKYTEMHVNRIRGERLRFIKENFDREYTDSAIQKVIDADPQFISHYTLHLEVKELHEKARVIVDAFKQRAYSLKNLTTVYEKALENITLRVDS